MEVVRQSKEKNLVGKVSHIVVVLTLRLNKKFQPISPKF